MTQYPTQFRKNSWSYRQLKRTGNVALYEQGGGCAYEVIRIKQNPERTIKGNVIPPHEAGPGDSEWGRNGWTLATIQRAEEKFAEICAADEIATKKRQHKQEASTHG